jgi:antirestriction protein ArdC
MSAVLSATKPNVYDAVTAQIIAAIEDGVSRCVMPWHGGIVPMSIPLNALTEMPYHGVNVVSLWATAATRLYPSGYWASYEQWRKLGAQVRKGERGSVIIFYKKLDGEAEPEADEAEAPRIVLRHSHVFNFAQVDGWELPDNAKRPSQVENNEHIAAFLAATKADVRHDGVRAFYHRTLDYIALPLPEHFRGTPTSSPTEAYYAVKFHEFIHWTGAPHRLARVKGKRYGDRDYAFEELVAELGAAFLCSAFRLVNEPRPDHAAYIAHWLDILSRDNRAIFAAASLAQQAVEYLRVLAGAAQP